MRSKRLVVSKTNFPMVQAHIERMIAQYRMNAENWVVARFRKLGTIGNPTSLAELNQWIELFLPDELANEIGEALEKQPPPADKKEAGTDSRHDASTAYKRSP